MEYTNIPSIEQKISRIGLGTWAIGGWMWGGSDENNSIATIHKALDLGINCIDAAPAYGFGISEEIIGKALKQHGKREHVIIATKLGLSWKNPQEVYRDSRKETIFNEINASLRRLQTDYIDLYQVHWPDTQTPISETAEALHQLMKEGKIRAIGVCNFSVDQMETFQKSAPLHALQLPFNIFENEIEKLELAYCMKKKLATLGYGSLCRGLLSGKMSKERKFKGDDLRLDDQKFQEPHFSEYLQCVEQLTDWVKEKHKRPLLALAIRWALDKGINIALWGARKPEQMDGVDTIDGWKLTDECFTEIDHIIQKTIKSPIMTSKMGPPVRKI